MSLSIRTLGAATAGVAVGAILLFYEPLLARTGLTDPFSAEEQEFLERHETLLWVFLILAQTGFWAVLVSPAIQTAGEVSCGGKWSDTLLGVLLLVAAIAPLVITGDQLQEEYPFPHHSGKLAVITGLGFLVILPAILAVWRIGRLAERMLKPAADLKAELRCLDPLRGSNELAGYLHLRDLLQRALLMVGVVVSAAILATGALRNAVVGYREDEHIENAFPIESVLAYGAYFSLLLALLYVPVHLRLQRLGGELVRRGTENVTGAVENLEKRAELQGLLKLDATPAEGLKAGVAILTPLGTSLIGALLAAE